MVRIPGKDRLEAICDSESQSKSQTVAEKARRRIGRGRRDWLKEKRRWVKELMLVNALQLAIP